MGINHDYGLSYKDYAEYAVRTNDIRFVYEGLASIERNINVLESYDVITLLALFYTSIIRLNENPDIFFLNYAKSVNNKKVKEYLINFTNRSLINKTIENMGYTIEEVPIFKYVLKNNND